MSDAQDQVATLAAAVRAATAGRTNEALATLTRSRFTGDLDPAALALRAQLLERAKRGAEAWAVLEEGLGRHPDHPGLLVRAGVTSYRRGDLVAAERLLSRAWSLAPLPEAAFFLGEIAAGSGDRPEATGRYLACAAFEDAMGRWHREALDRLADEEGSRR